MSILVIAIVAHTAYTGHTPDIDPTTATGQQANDDLAERTARINPALAAHPI